MASRWPSSSPRPGSLPCQWRRSPRACTTGSACSCVAAARQHRATTPCWLPSTGAMGLVGPDQASWLDHLEQEHDNLRTALRWAYERREAAIGTRLAGALGRFWNVRGHLTEGRQWAEAFLLLGTHSADVEGCAHRT